jgi:phosphoribosylanthranilate isomerase
MSTRIKICGLTRLADAELAVELGADALGVVLEETSPRYAGDNEEALSIPTRLGPYVLSVAVLGPYKPAPAQFHVVQCLPEPGILMARPLLPVVRVRPADTLETVIDRIGNSSAVVLDAHSKAAYGGTGSRLDWGLVSAIVAQSSAHVVLAGGLNAENVAMAIDKVKPYAVDVSSGVESAPGVKDHAMLRAFIAAARG